MSATETRHYTDTEEALEPPATAGQGDGWEERVRALSDILEGVVGLKFDPGWAKHRKPRLDLLAFYLLDRSSCSDDLWAVREAQAVGLSWHTVRRCTELVR